MRIKVCKMISCMILLVCLLSCDKNHNVVDENFSEDMKPYIIEANVDVNGDKKEELIELYRQNMYEGDIILRIYKDSSKKLLAEKTVLKDSEGILLSIENSDLNYDGVKDILISIHSGGVGYPNYYDYELYSFKDNCLSDIPLCSVISPQNIEKKLINDDVLCINISNIGRFEYKIPQSYKLGRDYNRDIGYYRGNQISLIDFDNDQKIEIKYEKSLKLIEIDDSIFFTIIYKFDIDKWKPIHLTIESDRYNLSKKLK